MKTRAITGFFFILVMLASIFTGPLTFTAFYILLSLLCLKEFFSLLIDKKIFPHAYIGYVISLFGFGYLATKNFIYVDFKWFLLIVPIICSVFFAQLYRKSTQPFTEISYTFLGILYTIVPFVFYYNIAFISGAYNWHLALGFFLLLWSNDTGAYLFGVKFGKHRLFERHSPKKSWEGFFGGVAISIIVAFILSKYFIEYATIHWIIMAIIISCFGTMGDLVESMFKRSLDVKDSGNLLPGHGGVLDRFDGLLISAPLVFVYLYLISN